MIDVEITLLETFISLFFQNVNPLSVDGEYNVYFTLYYMLSRILYAFNFLEYDSLFLLFSPVFRLGVIHTSFSKRSKVDPMDIAPFIPRNGPLDLCLIFF